MDRPSRRSVSVSASAVARLYATAFIDRLQVRQAAIAENGPRDDAYDIPYSTVHAGLMHGGTALNIVPNRCEIDFEIRNIAEDDPQAILAAIRSDAEAIVAPHRAAFPEAAIAIEALSGYPGLSTPEDSPAVQFLRQVTGDNGPPIKVAFGTEGGLFQSGLGIPTAICGPGFMSQGHKPDEFVSRQQLDECDRMLARLVEALA